MEFLGRSVLFLALLFFIYFWIFRSSFVFPFLSIVMLCIFTKFPAIKRNITSISILVEKRSKKEKNDEDLALPSDFVVIDIDSTYERSRGCLTSGGNNKDIYANLGCCLTRTAPGVNFSDEKEGHAATSQKTAETVIKNEMTLEPIEGKNGSYHGEITEGMYHGYGVESWGTKGAYKGQFCNGLWHGFAEYCAENGDRYEGTWQYGHKDGTGQQYTSDGTLYSGQFKNGIKHGLGWTRHGHGDWYAGEHEKGDMHGFGAYHFFNGDVYEGNWNDGNMHGYGCYKGVTGQRKSGIWEHNVLRISMPENHWCINRTIELVRLSALNAFLIDKVYNEVRAAVMQAEKAAVVNDISCQNDESQF